MEIIIEDGKVANLEELLKDVPWEDNPSADCPFACHSVRNGLGTINGVEYTVFEFQICLSPTTVLVREANNPEKPPLLDYHDNPPYLRNPHNGKMYYREGMWNQDLRTPVQEYNASIPYQNQSI